MFKARVDAYAISTLNSEIFAMVLISQNFAYAKFSENKTLVQWRDHSFIYWYRSILPLLRIFNVTNMSFNPIRKNKIIAKVFELTESKSPELA